jgi:hypothetical protein
MLEIHVPKWQQLRRLMQSLWCTRRLSIIGFIALVCATLANSPVAAQDRKATSEDTFARIKRAHFPFGVKVNSLSSYRISGCTYIQQSILPKGAIPLVQDCIKEQTGILKPSLAYLSIVVAGTNVTQLIDIEQSRGWQISTGALDKRSTPPLRKVATLQKNRYDALVEDTQHALLPFLAYLNSPDPQLELTSANGQLAIKWQSGESTNEFFFNGKTFLCEKQVRTVGGSSIVLKFSNYKRTSKVMLPYTIFVVNESGATLARREIDEWLLAAKWPSDYFTPDRVTARY